MLENQTEPSPNEMRPKSVAFKRHPMAIAWDAFKEKEKDCFNAGSLGSAANVYLENRLHRAFMAGSEAELAQMKMPCKWKNSFIDLWEGKCGASLMMKKSPREDKLKFCPGCGHRVEIDETKGGGAEKEGPSK